MTLFGRRATAKGGEVPPGVRTGFVGKIRSRPDFVRHAVGGEEIRAFDQWVHEGISYLGRRFPADWKERLGSFASHNFFVGGDDRMPSLAGTLCASQDKSGRQHPYVCFATFNALAPAAVLPYVAIQYRAFFAAAGVTADANGVPLDMEALVEHSQRLAALVPDFVEAALADERDDAWNDIDMPRFWRDLHPLADDNTRLAFVRDVQQTLRMAINRGPQRTAWGLRLPLPEHAPREPYVAFWLALIGEMSAAVRWRPHVFWVSDPAAVNPAVTVFFREPGPSSFAQLVCPDSGEGGVVDLVSRPLDNMPRVSHPGLLSLVKEPLLLRDALHRWSTSGVRE